MSTLARYALSSCAASVLLAGCAGSQPAALPQPGTMRLNRADVARTLAGDLLYLVGYNGGVAVFTYPQKRSVTTFTIGDGNLTDACVDATGDVFIPSVDIRTLSATIYEFAHGGTTPIAT